MLIEIYIFLLIAFKFDKSSCRSSIDELDMRIPFQSLLVPKFPKLVRREIKLNSVKTQLETRYSIHKLTILFYNCTKYYRWENKEKVIIMSDKNHPASIYIVYDKTINKLTKCICSNYIKVSFNLHGYPLMVIYENNYKQAIEESYPINFQFADIHLGFDKLFYKTLDDITIRCTLFIPWKYLFDGQLKIIPSDSNLTILSERFLNHDFILELVGKISPQVYLLNVTCRFSDIFIVKTVPIVANQGYKYIWIINYSGLAICLGFILISLILWAIYTLIIGRKSRLTYDVTAYHAECVEDRTIRFWDPILNNLTSPLRKYDVPGSLTVFLLRKNFNKLFSKLFSIYPKVHLPTLHGDTALIEMKREKGKRISEKYNPLLTSPLGKRVIQALGPQPKKKSIYLSPPFPDLPRLMTNLLPEKSKYPNIENHVPLDRQTISGLPYVVVAQKQNSPCWSIKDATVPIQYGVTYNDAY